MSVEWIRRTCMAFPHATEQVQWGNNLVFKIGGKIFAIAGLEPSGMFASFKVTPDEFAELIERPGVIPAPYLARAHWVALESEDALPSAEVRRLLRQSYDLVFARLPKKAQAALGYRGGRAKAT